MGSEESCAQNVVHPRLGRLQVRGQAMLCSHPLATLPDYQHWVEQLALVRDVPGLFLPLKCERDSGLCVAGESVQLTYPVFPQTLAQEIRARRTHGAAFSEEELWYLLYAVVRPMAALEERGLAVGDVQPCNVLLSQSGQVRLLSTFSMPCQLNSFHLTIQNENYQGLNSPEEMQ
jgi:hypothetical protein